MPEAASERGLLRPSERKIPRQASLDSLNSVNDGARAAEVTRASDGAHSSGDKGTPQGRVAENIEDADSTPQCYKGKRSFDLAIIAFVAVPVLIVGIVSAVAILFDDGLPLLFRQVRTGRDGKTFVLLKLRTMTNAKRRADTFPEPKDLTRAGRILRRMSIDELPQLINVLKGDMSIIGPRPTLPYQVQRYDSRQSGRLRVQPGLTGLAQVKGRNHMTWSERIEWDLKYVANQSFRLDLRVLVSTVRVIMSGDGVSGHPHHDPIARLEEGGAN